MCTWNTFDAHMNHMHTQTHKTHHGLNLREGTTSPLKIFSVFSHGLAPKCHFVPGLPTQIGTPKTLEAHNFLCRP
jgi:hypothetical protein